MKHFPQHGDAVEAWIKSFRDIHVGTTIPESWAWRALDDLLDMYRAHADFGVPLGEDLPDEAFK